MSVTWFEITAGIMHENTQENIQRMQMFARLRIPQGPSLITEIGIV